MRRSRRGWPIYRRASRRQQAKNHQLRYRLAALAKRHGVVSRAVTVPLSDPIDYPVIVAGLASTTAVDLGRQKFRAYAFINPCTLLSNQPMPPLYYKHDESRVVGEILELRDDARGNLRIRARVDDPLARRANAFSVGARVIKFSLHNENSADYFGLIEQAEIMEISLTDTPANPHALVNHRYRALPVAAYLDAIGRTNELMIKRVGLVQQLAQLLQQTCYEQQRSSQAGLAQASATSTRDRPAAPAVRRVANRPTEFSQLVEAINR